MIRGKWHHYADIGRSLHKAARLISVQKQPLNPLPRAPLGLALRNEPGIQ